MGFRGVFWALHTKNAHKKEKELQPFSYNSCLLFGAEGGTRQLCEKDSNQLAVLLDKLKEQGSYGDPVSGTFTRCA